MHLGFDLCFIYLLTLPGCLSELLQGIPTWQMWEPFLLDLLSPRDSPRKVSFYFQEGANVCHIAGAQYIFFEQLNKCCYFIWSSLGNPLVGSKSPGFPVSLTCPLCLVERLLPRKHSFWTRWAPGTAMG